MRRGLGSKFRGKVSPALGVGSNVTVTDRHASSDLDALSERFANVRARTERLAEPMSPEDQTVQTMPDVSPAKWHRAHTTWFFETFVLGEFVDSYQPFDDAYCFLFNSYYEAVGERHPRPERGLLTRPGASEVGEYRRSVDARTTQLIESAGDDPALAELIELGANHEEQHQELMLMDFKHVLSVNPTEPCYIDRPHHRSADPGPLGWVDFDGGVVTIGHAGAGFSFDNERPRHDTLLAPYRLADRLVTCGEWRAFIDDGGYERPELWLSDGWHRRLDEGWEAPLYWRRDGDEWRVHTLTGTRAVDEHEPVCHVSFYEADAFASWAEARLSTEAEWEHAVAGLTPAGNTMTEDPLDGTLHPAPAPAGVGLRQMIGDCWEWTGSPYRPYPGYRAPQGAIGEYNGKFMINTMVLKGGCAFTPPDHTRDTYRNFFHPHTRWHLSGVRLAADR